MLEFFKRLWETEKPSRARAMRKEAVLDAKWHLDRWADYGEPEDFRLALAVLEKANNEHGKRR